MVTTDENGVAEINGLYVGEGTSPTGLSKEYTIVENVPEGYSALEESYEVTVTPNNTTEKLIINYDKLGDFLVHKKVNDIDSNGKSLNTLGVGSNGTSAAGVTFRLQGTSLTGKEINMTAESDANGNAYFCNVPIGNGYIITEETSDKYYAASVDSQTVDIIWDQNLTYSSWLTNNSSDYNYSSEKAFGYDTLVPTKNTKEETTTGTSSHGSKIRQSIKSAFSPIKANAVEGKTVAKDGAEYLLSDEDKLIIYGEGNMKQKNSSDFVDWDAMVDDAVNRLNSTYIPPEGYWSIFKMYKFRINRVARFFNNFEYSMF